MTAGFLAASLASCVLLSAGCAANGRKAAAPIPPTTRPAVALTKPVLQPLTQPAYSLSNVVEQTLPAQPTFAFVSAQATVRTLAQNIENAIGELFKQPELGASSTGPLTIVYRGMTPTLDQPFALEVGIPVDEAFRPAGRVQVRPLPSFRSMTAEFAGPVDAIDKAYDRLYPTVKVRGLEPTGETRELYVHWSGPNDGENQIIVAVGVR